MIDDTNTMDVTPLEQNIKDIAQQVIYEEDLDKTKDLVALFNWNMSKKNVARLLKLNNLFDAVSDQMVERFMKKPDQFSNSDLLDYMKTVQSAIDNSTKALSQTEEPPLIVQNNTQININSAEPFTRESRAKIADAVFAILAKASKEQPADISVEDFEDKTEADAINSHTGD